MLMVVAIFLRGRGCTKHGTACTVNVTKQKFFVSSNLHTFSSPTLKCLFAVASWF